jgi:hypothetical protein
MASGTYHAEILAPMTWTQASVARAVKAAIQGAHAMGYRVAAYEVEFSQGIPTVRVTTGAESPPPPPVETGGSNVETLRKRLEERHAARRA